jgi:hypothetical protein
VGNAKSSRTHVISGIGPAFFLPTFHTASVVARHLRLLACVRNIDAPAAIGLKVEDDLEELPGLRLAEQTSS